MDQSSAGPTLQLVRRDDGQMVWRACQGKACIEHPQRWQAEVMLQFLLASAASNNLRC
jgi:hypothetical protein